MTTSTPTQRTLIQQRFDLLRSQGHCGLMPFLMAGDPDLDETRACLLALQAAGADLIELGIPYSDPLADGPVIQAAAGRALAAGTTPGRVLEMLTSLRGALTVPVILFTYSNPLLNRGMERFCREAAAAGAAGLVVPDLPLEEAERLSAIATAQSSAAPVSSFVFIGWSPSVRSVASAGHRPRGTWPLLGRCLRHSCLRSRSG